MRAGLAVLCLGFTACGSCGRTGTDGDAGPSANGSASSVVAEILPRCRGDAQRLTVPGENVVVGDVAVGPALLVGFIRDDAGKRVASVMRASLDLATSRVFDVGVALGDDPPPSPRWTGEAAYAAFVGRVQADGGPKVRTLQLARIEEGGLARALAPVLQQADESTAFDVAWSDGGGGLAAWDEDAPAREDAGASRAAERGFVKVQLLAEAPGTERPRPRVATPETSDAESPRLLARPGGYWLAWLARRVEEDTHAIEGPGEQRSFRWVEVTPLDARGESAGPVRRVGSEKGRAVAFDVATNGPDLVVVVEDEAASSDGAGARIVRYVVGERVESSGLIDSGVGHGLAELVPLSSTAQGASRWLAWTDTSERAHLTSLGVGLVPAPASPSLEPSLDGARVVAAVGADTVYALFGPSPNGERRPTEVRRFVCR